MTMTVSTRGFPNTHTRIWMENREKIYGGEKQKQKENSRDLRYSWYLTKIFLDYFFFWIKIKSSITLILDFIENFISSKFQNKGN